MRAVGVVVGHILAKHAAQVGRIRDDDVVRALPPKTTELIRRSRSHLIRSLGLACATVLAIGGAAMAFTLTSGTLDQIGEGGYGC